MTLACNLLLRCCLVTACAGAWLATAGADSPVSIPAAFFAGWYMSPWSEL